jgi:hypothetical protein
MTDIAEDIDIKQSPAGNGGAYITNQKYRKLLLVYSKIHTIVLLMCNE